MSKMSAYGLMLGMMALAGSSVTGGLGEFNITGVNHTGKPFEPTVKPPYKRPKKYSKKHR